MRSWFRSALVVAVAGCTADPAGPEPAIAPLVGLSPIGHPRAGGGWSRSGVATMLRVRTYDGSGQSTHPDVVRIPGGWHGYEYWMAYTPYPGGQEAFENPSVVASHDGRTWEVPAGLTNPIIRRPVEKDGYNSDPDLRYDAATDRLQMIYRQVRRGFNLTRVVTSADGIKWSRPRLLLARPNHEMISPTVAIGPDGAPRIWYVDAGSRPCASRETRVLTQAGDGAALAARAPGEGWGAATVAALVQPGYFIWHLDVTYIPEKQQYWAVYPAYPLGQCGARDLFFATSTDGLTWRTFATPMLRHEQQGWTAGTLYRASLLYDSGRDVVRVFLSGADGAKRWHLGYVEYRWQSLLDRLEQADVKTPAELSEPAGVPEDR